ncbi:MAG: hypothetical protein N3A58_05235 [Spirochaetes bacterium]|nr:hypothetical protein [Spirochaetota bacterium]
MKLLKNNIVNNILIILIILFVFTNFYSCNKKVENKLIGKWYYKLPGSNLFYTIEFFKDGKFRKEGYRYNGAGTFQILEIKKNLYIVQIDSYSDDFDRVVKINFKGNYIEMEYDEKIEQWYFQNTEEAKNIMFNAEKVFQHPSQYKSFDHYYLEKFDELGKSTEDLEFELGYPDSISLDENDSTVEIWLYGRYGIDEFGNIYSYQFFVKNKKVIKVNSILQN